VGGNSGISIGDMTAAQRQTDAERATLTATASASKGVVPQTISIKPVSENGDETHTHAVDSTTAASTAAGSARVSTQRNDSQDLAITPPPTHLQEGEMMAASESFHTVSDS